MPIEPRIRPLVEALNGTGLVQTFTSCEGHFGDHQPARWPGREQANVGFFLRRGVSECSVARLFGAVLAEYRRRGGDGVDLTIAKHYVAALDETDIPEVFFDFTIRPSDLGAACDAKRDLTDRCLAIVTRAVKRAVQTSGTLDRPRDDIERILAAHDAWKRRLADAIVTGRPKLTAEDVAKDDHCAVGEWLRAETGSDSPLSRIAELHSEFHREASNALKLALAEQTDVRNLVAPESAYGRTSADLEDALRSLAA